MINYVRYIHILSAMNVYYVYKPTSNKTKSKLVCRYTNRGVLKFRHKFEIISASLVDSYT